MYNWKEAAKEETHTPRETIFWFIFFKIFDKKCQAEKRPNTKRSSRILETQRTKLPNPKSLSTSGEQVPTKYKGIEGRGGWRKKGQEGKSPGGEEHRKAKQTPKGQAMKIDRAQKAKKAVLKTIPWEGEGLKNWLEQFDGLKQKLKHTQKDPMDPRRKP